MNSEKSLYLKLLEHSLPIQMVVEEWRHAYADDADNSLMLIYCLMFDCAGIQLDLPQLENISEVDIKCDEMCEDPIMPILSSQKFCSRLQKFISFFSSFRSHEIFRNEKFLKDFSVIICKLSSSFISAHRKTGIFFGLQLVDNLLELIEEDLSSTSSNSDSENESTTHNLSYLFDPLFHPCFHTGFRDRESNIRIFCMKLLKKWINLYPQKFIDSRFLRYIVWLSPVHSVNERVQYLKIADTVFRKSCSEASKLFAINMLPLLNAQMSSKNFQEIIWSTKCLHLISKKYPDLTKDINLHIIHQNLFHINRKVAKVAASYVIDDLKRTEGVENLSTSNVLLAHKLLYDLFPDSNKTYELSVFVDSFYDFSEVILNIHEMLHIFHLDNINLSTKRFFSLFVKTVMQRTFVGEPPNYRGENVEVKTDKKKVFFTNKILGPLGELVITFNGSKQILENFLDICQYLFCDETYPFDSDEFQNLLQAIKSTMKNSTEKTILESCSKALYALRSKCVSRANKTCFEVELKVLLDDYTSQFTEKLEILVKGTLKDTVSFYESLLALQNKLHSLGFYFRLPLEIFKGCHVFVTYTSEVLSLPSGQLGELTIWFSIISLCFEIMFCHLKQILNEDSEVDEFEKACSLGVCFQFFPKFLLFEHRTDPSLYFGNVFYLFLEFLILVHEKQATNVYVSEIQTYSEKCIFHFIRKRLICFQDEDSSKKTDILCLQLCKMITSIRPVSRSFLFALLDVLILRAENIFFQRNVISAIGRLLNDNVAGIFENISEFLIMKSSNNYNEDFGEKLRVLMTVLAGKFDKSACVKEVVQMHIQGLKLVMDAHINSIFLSLLSCTICFLNKDGVNALIMAMQDDIDNELLHVQHYKDYRKHVFNFSIAQE